MNLTLNLTSSCAAGTMPKKAVKQNKKKPSVRRLLYQMYINWPRSERELYDVCKKQGIWMQCLESFRKLLREFDKADTWEKMTPARNSIVHQQCLDDLQRIVDDDPSGYLYEYKQALAERGWKRSQSTIARMLKSPKECGGLGYSLQALQYKAWQKSYNERVQFLQTIRSEHYITAANTCSNLNICSRSHYDHSKMIWIDETHKSRNEARRGQGWAPKGKGARKFASFRDNKSFSALCAANQDGFVDAACYITEFGVDTERYEWWVEVYLLNMLGNFARGEPNSIVVLDNVNQHWSEKALRLIYSVGAVVSLRRTP